MNVTILEGGRTHVVEEVHSDGGEHLWLSPADLSLAFGWQLKPQGMCRGDVCVPVPPDASWTDAKGRVNVAAFARHLSKPVVHDEDHGVWAFGESATWRHERVPIDQAPDFTLPDLQGKPHSLSRFRGKKVFLFSWSSY